MVPTLRWFHRSTLETAWRPRTLRVTAARGCGQRQRPRAGEIGSSSKRARASFSVAEIGCLGRGPFEIFASARRLLALVHAVWAGASPACADCIFTDASRCDGRTGDSRSGSGGQAVRIDRRSEGSPRPRNYAWPRVGLRAPAPRPRKRRARRSRLRTNTDGRHLGSSNVRVFSRIHERGGLGRSAPHTYRPEMAARATERRQGCQRFARTSDHDGQHPSRQPIERAEADRRARSVVEPERASPRSACRRREPPDPLRVPRGPREHRSAGAGS